VSNHGFFYFLPTRFQQHGRGVFIRNSTAVEEKTLCLPD
jgi:hypothetical protein